MPLHHPNDIIVFPTRTVVSDGNAENITADGKANVMADGTMEAVYFGSGYAPKGKGSGPGPWIGERAVPDTAPLIVCNAQET